MASSLLVAPSDYSEPVSITLSPSTSVRALSPGPAPTTAGEGHNGSSNSGSSNKDIIGIAVGSAIGGAVVLVGLGILLWVCCRRRRLDRSDSEQSIAHHGRNSSRRGAPSALTRSSFGSSYPSGLVAPEPRSLKSVSPGGAVSYVSQPTGSPSTPSRPHRPARSLRSSLGIIIPDSPPSKIRVPPPHVSVNGGVDELDSAPQLALPMSMVQQHPNASQSSLVTPSEKWLHASPRSASGNTSRSSRSAKRLGQARLGAPLFQDGTEQQTPVTPPPRAAKRNSRFVQV
ncbi:uncharacterized protein LOC62_02G002856 [Vanrija pseudolonga]|uniref:Uncharacterized protein n=1 Tax=Vanrija pseudolonga TaxID=143232 RepID=A0AAF1BGU9_9TREE|nr:hypothetical protein LOC62_02G002856 [Vanrija pseudolonga]